MSVLAHWFDGRGEDDNAFSNLNLNSDAEYQIWAVYNIMRGPFTATVGVWNYYLMAITVKVITGQSPTFLWVHGYNTSDSWRFVTVCLITGMKTTRMIPGVFREIKLLNLLVVLVSWGGVMSSTPTAQHTPTSYYKGRNDLYDQLV